MAGTTVLVGGDDEYYMRLADFRTYEIGFRWLIDVEFPFSETCTESPLLSFLFFGRLAEIARRRR